uniref:Large ribosomal subunit protein eL24 n=1 Tax=Rattus norvegicus TaxID=10116 RepID=A0A8I6G430_RAT
MLETCRNLSAIGYIWEDNSTEEYCKSSRRHGRPTSVTMKVNLCSFSGYKIYSGHERLYARTDGKFSSFLMPNVSPHSFPKGTLGKLTGLSSTEENTRKDSRKKFKRKEPTLQKFQRAITGASLADIMAKRNQKPEVRKAQQEQAIRDAKEAKKAKQASKKTAMAAAKAPTKAAPKQKIVKPVKVSAPRVGGKR